MPDDREEQLRLGDLDPAPTVAERAFLKLAAAWRKRIQETPGQSQPRAVDEIAFACLLLSVEWGRRFRGNASAQAWMNKQAAGGGLAPWLDEMLWELCAAGMDPTGPGGYDALERLTANLNHHSSSIRFWLLEIGWFVRSWLDAAAVVPPLLENLATALGGPFESAGLAIAVAGDEEVFWRIADNYDPPERSANQYRDRLSLVREEGASGLQWHFYRLEARCRKIASDAVFDDRLVAENR